MSASSSPSQSDPVGDTKGVAGASSAEIDISCRAPLLLLFISGAAWLVFGSCLGLIASLKFHLPSFLANCAWLTYGRVHPAALNALVYGGGPRCGLGAFCWLVFHPRGPQTGPPAPAVSRCVLS